MFQTGVPNLFETCSCIKFRRSVYLQNPWSWWVKYKTYCRCTVLNWVDVKMHQQVVTFCFILCSRWSLALDPPWLSSCRPLTPGPFPSDAVTSFGLVLTYRWCELLCSVDSVCCAGSFSGAISLRKYSPQQGQINLLGGPKPQIYCGTLQLILSRVPKITSILILDCYPVQVGCMSVSLL